jgi:hypothetical protein
VADIINIIFGRSIPTGTINISFFCVTQIVSVSLTDIIKGLPTDTINIFFVVVSYFFQLSAL